MKIIWNIKSFNELTLQEFHDLVQARIEVFVVEQNCPYPELDGYDGKAIHFWAEQNGEILAYCRVFAPEIKYKEASIGRVLTTKIGRGKNIGRQMMKYAVEIIDNRFHTSEIRISAQDYLISFYKEFGFLETSKKYLEDDIPHTEMYRK